MSEERAEYVISLEWGDDVITRTLQDVWDHRTTVSNAATAIRALVREEVLKALGVWTDDGDSEV